MKIISFSLSINTLSALAKEACVYLFWMRRFLRNIALLLLLLAQVYFFSSLFACSPPVHLSSVWPFSSLPVAVCV